MQTNYSLIYHNIYNISLMQGFLINNTRKPVILCKPMKNILSIRFYPKHFKQVVENAAKGVASDGNKNVVGSNVNNNNNNNPNNMTTTEKDLTTVPTSPIDALTSKPGNALTPYVPQPNSLEKTKKIDSMQWNQDAITKKTRNEEEKNISNALDDGLRNVDKNSSAHSMVKVSNNDAYKNTEPAAFSDNANDNMIFGTDIIEYLSTIGIFVNHIAPINNTILEVFRENDNVYKELTAKLQRISPVYAPLLDNTKFILDNLSINNELMLIFKLPANINYILYDMVYTIEKAHFRNEQIAKIFDIRNAQNEHIIKELNSKGNAMLKKAIWTDEHKIFLQKLESHINKYELCDMSQVVYINRTTKETQGLLSSGKVYLSNPTWGSKILHYLIQDVQKTLFTKEQYLEQISLLKEAKELLLNYTNDLPERTFLEIIRRIGVVHNNDATYIDYVENKSKIYVEMEGLVLKADIFDLITENREKYSLPPLILLTEKQKAEILHNIEKKQYCNEEIGNKNKEQRGRIYKQPIVMDPNRFETNFTNVTEEELKQWEKTRKNFDSFIVSNDYNDENIHKNVFDEVSRIITNTRDYGIRDPYIFDRKKLSLLAQDVADRKIQSFTLIYNNKENKTISDKNADDLLEKKQLYNFSLKEVNNFWRSYLPEERRNLLVLREKLLLLKKSSKKQC